ncbi:Uncharacterised protein [Klebsiella michiganensis]|nr:Uncharacterised protein [Klebsiella michiganensis]
MDMIMPNGREPESYGRGELWCGHTWQSCVINVSTVTVTIFMRGRCLAYAEKQFKSPE